jgi:hypothetical protein
MSMGKLLEDYCQHYLSLLVKDKADSIKDFSFQDFARGKYGYDETAYHRQNERSSIARKLAHGDVLNWGFSTCANFIRYLKVDGETHDFDETTRFV